MKPVISAVQEVQVPAEPSLKLYKSVADGNEGIAVIAVEEIFMHAVQQIVELLVCRPTMQSTTNWDCLSMYIEEQHDGNTAFKP